MIYVQDLIDEYGLKRDEPMDVPAMANEVADLAFALESLRGNGGDIQWNGDWYPSELIEDCEFVEYARQLAEDAFELKDTWPHYCIDWEFAARELKYDYTSIELDGVTYWYR